jgi:hypothetical protein
MNNNYIMALSLLQIFVLKQYKFSFVVIIIMHGKVIMLPDPPTNQLEFSRQIETLKKLGLGFL